MIPQAWKKAPELFLLGWVMMAIANPGKWVGSLWSGSSLVFLVIRACTIWETERERGFLCLQSCLLVSLLEPNCFRVEAEQSKQAAAGSVQLFNAEMGQIHSFGEAFQKMQLIYIVMVIIIILEQFMYLLPCALCFLWKYNIILKKLWCRHVIEGRRQ